MEEFGKRLKNLLVEYKDTDIDEVTGWDSELLEKIKKLYDEDSVEFFTILKQFIWEFDYNSGIMDFLSACILGDSDYKSDAHLTMLLEIFDRHPDENKRIMALGGMSSFKNNFLPELERRYEEVKSMRIRNKMGSIIVSKICMNAGHDCLLGLQGQAYKGNIDRFNDLLDFDLQNQDDNLKLIKLLRDLKYIPNNMRAHLEELYNKNKSDDHE